MREPVIGDTPPTMSFHENADEAPSFVESDTVFAAVVIAEAVV